MAEGGNGDWKEQIAEIAECPICSCQMRNNRLLPCGHTFCLGCLEQYKRKTKPRAKSLPCPVCRKEFAIPKGGCSVLPKNVIVEKILEADGSNKEQEIYFKKCDVCGTDNVCAAVVCCIQCEQNMCGSCEGLHRRLRSSANHHVVPVSDRSHFKECSGRSYCEHHPKFELELMCNECATAICWKCRSITHTSHRCTEISETANQCSEQLQNNLEVMESRLSILRKLVENLKDQEKQHQEHYEKERQRISRIAAELIRAVVSKEESLIKKSADVMQKNIRAIQPNKQSLEKQIELMQQHKSAVEQLNNSANSLEIINCYKDLHKKTEELLSSNIINVRGPVIKPMSDENIQEYLIGTKADIGGSGVWKPQRSESIMKGFKNQMYSDNIAGTVQPTESDQEISAKTNAEDQDSMPETRISGSVVVKANVLQKTSAVKLIAQQLSDIAASPFAIQSSGREIRAPASLRSPSNEFNVTVKPPVLPKTKMVRSVSESVATTSESTQHSSLPQRRSEQPVSHEKRESALFHPNIETNAKELNIVMWSKDPESVTIMPGDGAALCGLAVCDQQVYTIAENSTEVTVYDAVDFKLLYKLAVKDLIMPSDLICCPTNNCLYIIDWKLYVIFRIGLKDSQNIIKWGTDGTLGGLSRTSQGNVLLASHYTNSLREYTPVGVLVKSIELKSDISEGIRPWHAIKLRTGNFIVTHGSATADSWQRVCLFDNSGQIVKVFGGPRGRGNVGLSGPYHLSVNGKGNVFVVDTNNGRIVLLNNNLEYLGEIKDELRKPRRLCLDGVNERLYVADNSIQNRRATDGRTLVFSWIP